MKNEIIEALYDKNLTAIEKVVYIVLCDNDIKENGIIDNLSYAKIGEMANLSESRARQIISSLIKKGYIIKENRNIDKNNTRNTYTLIKKVIQNKISKLRKMSVNKEQQLSNNNNNQLVPTSENSSFPSDGSLPIYTIDNTDDIDTKVKELKEKEGEEIVDKALKKMEKYNINRKGFISYLIKTITSLKNYTYTKVNTYVHKTYNKKSPKPSTFNNFKQRDYNFKSLKSMLLGREEYNPDELYL